MLHGAISSLLPTSNQHHTTSLNSADLSGTVAEAFKSHGIIPAETNPRLQSTQKKITQALKVISVSLFH